MNENTPQLLSSSDVARALGRSRQRVDQLVSMGRIPAPQRVGAVNIWFASQLPEILAAVSPIAKNAAPARKEANMNAEK